MAEQSKRAFYEKNLGEIRQVIVEESDGESSFGYTENYIRTRIPESLPVGAYTVQLKDIEKDVCLGKRLK